MERKVVLLLDTKLSIGDLLVKGKTWTGFANSEEQFADSFVGRRIQPFWIEGEARKIPGKASRPSVGALIAQLGWEPLDVGDSSRRCTSST